MTRAVPPVLIVATQPPWPTTNGIRTKLAGLVSALNGDCDVISPGATDRSTSIARAQWMSPDVNHSVGRVRTLLRGDLPVCGRLPSEAVRSLVERRLHGEHAYSTVHLDTVGTAHLASPLRSCLTRSGHRPTVVASINDSYSLILESLTTNEISVAHLRAAYALRFERKYLPCCDVVHVVSTRDQDWLRAKVPRARVQLVPLGIDVTRFAGSATPSKYDVLYMGSCSGGFTGFVMGLLTEVLPTVLERRPSTQIALAGPDAPAKVLEALSLLGGHHLGFVEDHAALLQSARLLVVPSNQNSGTPTKALEAMAAGVPVVGLQALEGLPFGINDVHYSMATDHPDLARRILNVLDDPGFAARIAISGQAMVREHHDWPTVMSSYFGH